MIRRDLLAEIRVSLSDKSGLRLQEAEFQGPEGEVLRSGLVRSDSTGETYRIRPGYLDLLGKNSAVRNVANLSNYLPGAGAAYEPLWRVRSLDLLTGEKFSNQREVQKIAEMLRITDGSGADTGERRSERHSERRYLDLGCSAGLYTRELARLLGASGHVVGVDISPSMLRQAARNCEAAGVEASLLRADAESLPFAPESFDGVLCGGSLNEFGNPGRALAEAARVLKPGGRIAIMGLLKSDTPRGSLVQRFLNTGGAQFFSTSGIREMLSEAGLTPEELETYGGVFFAAALKES